MRGPRGLSSCGDDTNKHLVPDQVLAWLENLEEALGGCQGRGVTEFGSRKRSGRIELGEAQGAG